MKPWAFLLLLPWPLQAEQTCADLTLLSSTSTYVAPASTTTLKVDLLKELYQTRYERDRLRVEFLWAALTATALDAKIALLEAELVGYRERVTP